MHGLQPLKHLSDYPRGFINKNPNRAVPVLKFKFAVLNFRPMRFWYLNSLHPRLLDACSLCFQIQFCKSVKILIVYFQAAQNTNFCEIIS